MAHFYFNTWELHVYRKLKNRVAAQTARDRKKARMETLEEAVSKIHDQVGRTFFIASRFVDNMEMLAWIAKGFTLH